LQRVVNEAEFRVRRHSVAPTAISIDPDKFHIPARHPQGQRVLEFAPQNPRFDHAGVIWA
jgi:hypothetical protein